VAADPECPAVRGRRVLRAYTTWSTVMTETVLRVRDHHVEVAVLYVMVSLTGGLAASYCGVWAARRRRRRPT